MITGDDLHYLVSVLNSSVMRYFFPLVATDLGENGNRYFKQFVELLPIPKVSESTKRILTELVIQIHKVKSEKRDTTELENQINHHVYDLYSLTPEEIAIIERGA
jgi:adenine-specific DNA-methyltransferase